MVNHGSDWGPALEKYRALDPRYQTRLETDLDVKDRKSTSSTSVGDKGDDGVRTNKQHKAGGGRENVGYEEDPV